MVNTIDATFPEALYQLGVDSAEANNVLAEHRDLAHRLRDQGKTFEVLIKSQARSPATHPRAIIAFW